jgi:hypothetical protein
VFELRSVRPERQVSSSWTTVADEDLLDDDESRETFRPRGRSRGAAVRIVGYLLIAALFGGTAHLLAQRPIRDAILDWTTFGLTEYVRATEKRIVDLVRRW